MNVFEPLTMKSSPSRTALVAMPRRSEPAPGSDIAIAPTSSPVTIRGSQSARCASVA